MKKTLTYVYADAARVGEAHGLNAVAPLPRDETRLSVNPSLQDIMKLVKESNCLLTATSPGAGKTFACEEYMKQMSEEQKSLFVVPTQKRVQEMTDKGFDTTTYHKFAGLRVSEEQRKKPMDLSEYQTVCFDEIGQVLAEHQARLKEIMRVRANIRYIATLGKLQLSPIGDRLSSHLYPTPKDKKTYYHETIARQMFDTIIELTEIHGRRWDSDIDADRVMSLSRALFPESGGTPSSRTTLPHWKILAITKAHFSMRHFTSKESDIADNVLCYKRSTRQRVNRLLHERHAANVDVDDDDNQKTELPPHSEKGSGWMGGAVWPGLKVKCDRRLYLSGSAAQFNVAFLYTIAEVRGNGVVFAEFPGTAIGFAAFRKHFTARHCHTVHSVQGSSITGRTTICDLDCFLVSSEWAFTALSRPTKHRDLNFFVPASLYAALRKTTKRSTKPLEKYFSKNKDEQKKMRARFAALISTYRATDAAKKGGESCDLDPVFLEEMLRRQKGRCALNLPTCQHALCVANVSVDRVDSTRAHLRSNVQLTCLNCNRQKQDRGASFIFAGPGK